MGEPALRGYKQVHNEGGVGESPWEFSGKIVSSDSSARVEFNVQMRVGTRGELMKGAVAAGTTWCC